jgi:hypothetical protein
MPSGSAVGSRWDAGLPFARVPDGAAPKPVTFVYPYYCNPSFLRRQVGWWHTYAPETRAHLRAIIVDDGSPADPADAVIRAEALPFPVRVFRIEVDVRWNWLAARNLGAEKAPEGWLAITDMDHVVPESTARALVYGQHDEAVIYGFSRRESTGEPLAAHPNSWFLTRAMFWRVGGYDEALSGHYGTDGDWRRRCAATARVEILRDRLIRYEYDGDSSTTRYLRKQPEDAAVSRIVRARKPGWRPKALSFPYREVAL